MVASELKEAVCKMVEEGCKMLEGKNRVKKEESWLQYVPSGWCVFMRRRSKKWGVAEFLFLLEVFLANVCDRRFCFEPLEKVARVEMEEVLPKVSMHASV